MIRIMPRGAHSTRSDFRVIGLGTPKDNTGPLKIPHIRIDKARAFHYNRRSCFSDELLLP